MKGEHDPVNTADAFETAVRSGATEDVRRLIDADPGLANREVNGVSPVLLALFTGNEDTARLLAERGATLGTCEAAALGSVEALQRASVAPSEADAEAASGTGQEPTGGVPGDLGTPGALGWTPLHLAAFLGRREATAWLLGQGVDPVVRSLNEEANTPLHSALAGRNDAEVVRLLLEGGADPQARGGLGVTPLHLAASRGSGDAVGALLASGALPVPMEDGRMPSDLADERGHPGLAKRLRELEEPR